MNKFKFIFIVFKMLTAAFRLRERGLKPAATGPTVIASYLVAAAFRLRFRKRKQLLVATGLIVICLAGCFSTKYVESKHYLLDIKTPIKIKTVKDRRSLFVVYTSTVTPFDQLNFLYRVSDSQYVTDYYHSFLALPSEQIKSALVNYLKMTEAFKLEAEESTASNKLQVQLVAFYADYRSRTKPKAITTLRFVLTQKNSDKT